MSEQWFCAVNGEQSGPYDNEQVRSMVRQGRLKPDDLAWQEGMADWTPVGSIPALAAQPAARVQAPASVPAVSVPPRGMQREAYAAAPAADRLPPVPAAPVIGPDEGPFLKVGGSFSTGKSRWNGPAVASPQAFYLLKESRQEGGGAAGLIGAALASDDDTRTCAVAELPPAVQAQLDPKGRLPGGDVIVLPRAAISRVKVPAVNNAVYVIVGGDRFTLFTMLFRNGKIRQFLTDNGWTVNADVQPTAAAVHGQGFGRTADAPAPHGPSTLARVLYILLAIAIFVAVFAYKMNRNEQRRRNRGYGEIPMRVDAFSPAAMLAGRAGVR
jgi:hypothetical protein